jgi:hypothetical protein
MRPETALVLRMVGPLIELACLYGLFAHRGRGERIAGVPVETLCYLGLAVGFLIVLAGLTLVRRVQPTKRPPRD